MNTDSFIMNVKMEDFHKDIANDVEKKYDTSNYVSERPSPIGKNKKVIGLMKDELGGRIMKEFFGLGSKCYSYLMDDGEVDKRAKVIKKCVRKRYLLFNNYVESLKEKKKILRSQKSY